MKAFMGLSDEHLVKLNSGEMLPIMEEFYTIQGEGFHSGKAAWFIRIGGCDVGCHWCDVKESWNPNHFPPKDVVTSIQKAVDQKVDTVVITGGEPLNFNLDFITSLFKKNNIHCHIETSGSSILTGHWDWICLSPKKNKHPLNQIFDKANELKVIIEDELDLIWAEENAAKVNSNCHLFLQPEWSKRELVMKLIIPYILNNTKWNISLQTHKYMHIP
jgi:7-carboxy-7-deazaguanine synthase